MLSFRTPGQRDGDVGPPAAARVQPAAATSRFPTRFTLGLVAVLAALVGVQVVGVNASRSTDRAADARNRLTEAIGEIRYYDELLTMSARLAVATGDAAYVHRYSRGVPRLDRAIREAQSVVPDTEATEAVRATDRANQALIALEEEGFRRLAAGDRAGASAVINSREYAELKAEYGAGMDVAVERMQLVSAQREAEAVQRQQLSLIAGVAGAVLLVVMWIITARGLRRSQRARGRVEEQLRAQAHADPLTGLANRRLFRERVAAALSVPDPGEPVVMFLDLDHFKTVNDTRGHADGDALLVEVADRVNDLIHGRPGALVARLGGDEFAVLLRSTDMRATEQLADRLVAALARPYPTAPGVPISASIGVACAVPGERDPGALLRGADLAMYDAKSAGRRQWRRYADHMYTDLVARVELEGQLRESLHRGELVVHYQPIQHVRTGRQSAVEALVRWDHPQRGLLPASAFVPLAEGSDLIVEVGRFVLEQACRHLAAWQTQSGDVAPGEVHVNVSPRELRERGYAAQVLAVLHMNGLPASSLVIELSESTLTVADGEVVAVLAELRAACVRVAIDNFGTDRSSLARLHEIPADMIKIDRSFVQAAATDDTTRLELIVALADHLQLDLVVEGIETTRQLDMARDIGCAYAQGHLLGRPQSADPARQRETTADR